MGGGVGGVDVLEYALGVADEGEEELIALEGLGAAAQ